MPGENIQDWSVTAIDNGGSDSSIIWSEGQARNSVNNSARSMMAAHAKNRNLLNGSIVTGGTINNQTFTSGVGYSGTVPTGLVVKLKIGAGLTNTASATLNMDGIGDTLIKTDIGDDLKGGELIAGCYTDFLFNGTNWVFLYSREYFQEKIDGGDGIIIGKQIFSTVGSFVYTPTVGMQCCIIECIGGGAGGGAAAGDINHSIQGGGGGAGGYSRKYATAADIGASQVVTVGVAGAGSGSTVPGNSGGQTSVGTLCIANGGLGGAVALVTVPPAGGAGGNVSGAVGDVTAGGTPGGCGFYSAAVTTITAVGNGGPGPFGGGGAGSFAAAGNAGTGYGSGGSGGYAHQSGATSQGGAGIGGIVIIVEFSGRGVPGRDGVDGAQGPIGPAGPSGPGTGDVLRFGTPTINQIAQWTDASHIQGVAASSLGLFSGVVARIISASGTYTPTAGMKRCIIECIGGGGGGGAAGGQVNMFFAAGGGGAGGYSRKYATAATIGASQVVTIGAAGTPNGAGGTTSVGVLCTAAGGGAGGDATSATVPVGGLGGTAGGGAGDFVCDGAPGGSGMFNSTSNNVISVASFGGSSAFGGGGRGEFGASVAGKNYGSGGSGGSINTAGTINGAFGSPGIVVITEFI